MAIDIPLGGILPLGIIWNAIFTCSISVCLASCQRVFWFFLYMTYASLTILGSLISNLWVLLRYWVLHLLTMEIIWSIFFRILNSPVECWFSMHWATACSATWIGCNSLRLESISYDVDPTFQQMSQQLSAYCDLSSYGSYCGVSSTPRWTKSLNLSQGSSTWCRDSMNKLCPFLHSSHSQSYWVSAWYVDPWRTWPFCFIIFTIKAGLISMLGPRYIYPV